MNKIQTKMLAGFYSNGTVDLREGLGAEDAAAQAFAQVLKSKDSLFGKPTVYAWDLGRQDYVIIEGQIFSAEPEYGPKNYIGTIYMLDEIKEYLTALTDEKVKLEMLKRQSQETPIRDPHLLEKIEGLSRMRHQVGVLEIVVIQMETSGEAFIVKTRDGGLWRLDEGEKVYDPASGNLIFEMLPQRPAVTGPLPKLAPV